MRQILIVIGCAAAALAWKGAQAADVPKHGRIVLTRLAEQLPAGTVSIELDRFTFTGCKPERTVRADGALNPVKLDAYAPLFAAEIGSASGAAVQKATNLFADTAPDDGVAFEVGGLVHGMKVKACAPPAASALVAPVPGVDGYRGNSLLQIQWQIYSRATHQVVATIETEGVAKTGLGRAGADTLDILIHDAFVDAVRKLSASPEFRAVLDRPAAKDELESRPGDQPRISAAAGPPAARAINEAVAAVVLIKTADAHGSGVLISSDGYVLTDAHVVGAAQKVKIRWSDGLETQGEVLRVHKKRDVALIKTDPRGRAALPVRTSAVQPGETVFSIGAPLEESLQGTVTRGIVSANRVIDGFSFIQSDVAVNHGNSGGPLLDEKGYVLGLTDIGLQPVDNAQIGLNFFTPVKDALDFLSLDLTPAPIPASPPVQKVSAPAAVKTR